MSKHTFTPGPWSYRQGNDIHRPMVIRQEQGGFVVMGLSRSREEADARLIAAAPKLLEACKAAELEAERLGIDFPCDTLAFIRAAISEATGES